MKNKLIPPSDFTAYIAKVLGSFSPNSEISPVRDEKLSLDRFDFIDLNDQEPGALIFLRGRHSGADYRLRVNQNRTVDIWRDIGTNGLKAPLECIVSWVGSPEGSKIEEGLVRAGSYSLMPYFSYDRTKTPLESVKKPNDIWGDIYLLIFKQK